jgi:uncharacterized membrane protein YkvA (DUF1232 family)
LHADRETGAQVLKCGLADLQARAVIAMVFGEAGAVRRRMDKRAWASNSGFKEGDRVADRLKQWARSVRRDAHAVYLAARDPRTPWYVKVLALCVAAYALSPIDLIPDFIPVLGYLDDIVIVPLGILAVVKLMPPDIMAEHRQSAALAAEQPVSRTAGMVIALIWIGSIGVAGWMIVRHFGG